MIEEFRKFPSRFHVGIFVAEPRFQAKTHIIKNGTHHTVCGLTPKGNPKWVSTSVKSDLLTCGNCLRIRANAMSDAS